MTFKKQILYIFILYLMSAFAQNVDAMRCGIKPLVRVGKAPYFNLQSFCSNVEKSNNNLKDLQKIYASLENIQPHCFNALAKNNAYGCKYESSCCLFAKNDARQAEEGKVIHLQEMSADSVVYIALLKSIVEKLSTLQQKNVEFHVMFSESQDKETLEPLRKEFCELTKNISECLVYRANIYGTTFYECSGRYYEKNPRGIFDFTKHMTLQEQEREKLQNECNKINKQLMKRNGYSLNQHILLGWGAHTMDPEYIGAWLGAMERLMKDHDQYKKDGGGVY